MSNNRELLKLAAKAAGIDALHDPQGVLRDCTGFHESMNIFAAKPWNPLTDDGDALRLADIEESRAKADGLVSLVAIELRRLHAVNAELLEALESIALSEKFAKELEQQWCAAASGMVRIARAAIAKAEGMNKATGEQA